MCCSRAPSSDGAPHEEAAAADGVGGGGTEGVFCVFVSPESVEASPAVNEKNSNNQSCGSAQNHAYQGLPYAVSPHIIL